MYIYKYENEYLVALIRARCFSSLTSASLLFPSLSTFPSPFYPLAYPRTPEGGRRILSAAGSWLLSALSPSALAVKRHHVSVPT